MAKKAKKTVKNRKAGPRRKQATAKSTAKKKGAKSKPAKAKKGMAAKKSRSAVKVSKPKRKSVASRKASVVSAAPRGRKTVASKPKATSPQVNAPHPGMMGDGTEEQNLNQKGNPGARITQEEIDAAFKKPD
ncbi:MAG TPA: hypothetical protein VM144_00410 [Aestuariivirga sp.]|nr:hypothetical protein [Aestuariivirga sp.]